MICRPASRPKPPSAVLMTRKDRNDVNSASCILPYSFAPKYWLTTTDAPMPPPMATQMKMLVSA